VQVILMATVPGLKIRYADLVKGSGRCVLVIRLFAAQDELPQTVLQVVRCVSRLRRSSGWDQ
jgi:hypothetical protein